MKPLDVSRLLAAREQHGLLAVFDLDGTLASIASTPEAARIPVSVRRNLAALLRREDTRVGVISGRPFAEMARLLGRALFDRLFFVSGLHGYQFRGPDKVEEKGFEKYHIYEMKGLLRTLMKTLAPAPAVRFEKKGPVLAAHTRAVDARRRKRLEERLVSLRPRGWRVIRGRCVVEFRPADAPDKGVALERARKFLPHAVVLYAGDDVTDEDAFRKLRAGDFPVLVGGEKSAFENSRRKSRARYSLENPAAVGRLIALLAERKSA